MTDNSSNRIQLPPNASMRDIFDYCQKMNLPSVAQGMIELDPPATILELARDKLFIGGQDSVHMYRGRLGEDEYLDGVLHMLHEHYRVPVSGGLKRSNLLATQGVTGACVALFATLMQQRLNKIGLVSPFYTYHLKQIYSVFGDNHPVHFIDCIEGEEDASSSSPSSTMIDFDALENNLLKKGELHCLIICNPCNPSTRIWPRSDLDRLVQLCARYGVILLLDECYCDMVWSNGDEHGRLYTPLIDPETQSVHSHVVVARGFSKNLGCQSWRVGYAIAHESMVQKMAMAADPIYICVPWLQHPMGKYLREHLTDFQEHLNRVNQLLRANWTVMRDAFVEALGWEAIEPEGTMYGLFRHGKSSDMEAVQDALEKGVGVTPCNIFYPGTPKNTGLIRIHCGISEEKAKLIAQLLLSSGSSSSK